MYEQLLDKLKEINISPIFFIGSGISRRYINTPDWIGLLKEIRGDWDRSFGWYQQKHTINGICNCEELASELADMYFYKLSDLELIDGKDRGYYFKNRICDIISGKLECSIDSINSNEEIHELKNTSPSAIITTNYDCFLEEIFDKYTKYIGQSELLQKNIDGVGDIYKIHGCITKPESIVITKSDYENFNKNSHYLNAKLLTSFLEYPIVFMGYSLSDRNVKSILDTIVDMLGEEKSKELSTRMWFLNRNETDSDYKSKERIELNQGRFIDIEVYYVKDFKNFYNVLNNHDIKRVPIPFLKYIKANTYSVVSSQEYDPKMINANIIDLESFDESKSRINFLSISKAEVEVEIETVMNRSDICEAFINENYNVKEYSAIKAKLNSNAIIPIFWNIKNRTVKEIFKYIDNIDGTKNGKDNIKRYINNREPINANKFSYYNFNIIYLQELTVEKLNKYIEETTCDYKANNNKVRRQCILYIIKYRLEDLILNKEVINCNDKIIISLITYLDKQFIIQNKKQIFEVLRLIENKNYDGNFRKALEYLDICLYKTNIIY